MSQIPDLGRKQARSPITSVLQLVREELRSAYGLPGLPIISIAVPPILV